MNPYDPFAPDPNEAPHPPLPSPHSHPTLHHSDPRDFTPDFTPRPEEAIETPLPFPCFRYEEELAAALLQNGAVQNMEHLLAVAPGCTMPPEVVDCFPGRFVGKASFSPSLTTFSPFSSLESTKQHLGTNKRHILQIMLSAINSILVHLILYIGHMSALCRWGPS